MMKLKHLPLAHRAEKWTRFSAPNDALIKEGSIGWTQRASLNDALSWRLSIVRRERRNTSPLLPFPR
jgi:hypothetical protein